MEKRIFHYERMGFALLQSIQNSIDIIYHVCRPRKETHNYVNLCREMVDKI